MEAKTSKEQWDARYSDNPESLFGTDPTEYLRQVVARSDFAAGDILMMADGDGRNGRWLAHRGLSVTAVDLSEVATVRAREADAEAGVQVTRIAADLAEWRGHDMAFDAVILIAMHATETVRRQAVLTAASLLRNGGWFVLEGFHKAQARRGTMGPPDPGKLYDAAEVLGWLEDFDLIEAMTGPVLLAEGTRHQGIADMVHLIARKHSGDDQTRI